MDKTNILNKINNDPELEKSLHDNFWLLDEYLLQCSTVDPDNIDARLLWHLLLVMLEESDYEEDEITKLEKLDSHKIVQDTIQMVCDSFGPDADDLVRFCMTDAFATYFNQYGGKFKTDWLSSLWQEVLLVREIII